MFLQVVFWGLLCGIRYVGAAAPTASWTTPTASNGDLKANTQDSVWMDWKSTYDAPVLRMWCWDEAIGGEALASSFSVDNNGPFEYIKVELTCVVCLASSFSVDNNGPFEYIMDSFMEPNKMPYPLSCQAELANGDDDDNGIRCPVKIVWSLDADIAAKTVNAPAKTTTAAPKTSSLSPSSTQTSVKVGDPKVTGTSGLATPSPSNTEQSTTDSPSKPTANLTSNTEQASSPSTGGSESDTNSTTAPAASTSSSSNNTGAIVGGVVGGIAVLSFIIFAFLFLRRQRRNRGSFSASANESSRWNFFFNFENKQGVKADTGPVYEKEGSGMARELEANAAGGAWKANHTAPFSPVELPASSNQHP
ncbi:hypothetical protein V498_01055 [Pseudogymnoascus sp. VKM F-4517 (FW-2822)]|nr:hypothetical protein V498_01055 [Pseudogymnoascus sp. VKM F-4517 (FW-2822)]